MKPKNFAELPIMSASKNTSGKALELIHDFEEDSNSISVPPPSSKRGISEVSNMSSPYMKKNSNEVTRDNMDFERDSNGGQTSQMQFGQGSIREDSALSKSGQNDIDNLIDALGNDRKNPQERPSGPSLQHRPVPKLPFGFGN
mmetsp:Transcript_5444/g.8437  ORF Transcript_5444/g.8437 Transcript_5444/m.8437 type:complete len:143 (+) Transcript_5444:1627-2055(+)